MTETAVGRDARSADPIARRIFRILSRCPEADATVVWKALGDPQNTPKPSRRAAVTPPQSPSVEEVAATQRPRVIPTAQPAPDTSDERAARRLRDRQDLVLRSVRRFTQETGTDPTSRTYEPWYDDLEDQRGVASTSVVQKAFGGWGGLADALNREAKFSEEGLRLRALGPFFKETELHAIVRHLAAELKTEYLSFRLDYLPFLERQTQLPPAERAFERLPKSRSPFESGDRSWEKVVLDAGLKGVRSPTQGYNRSVKIEPQLVLDAVRVEWDALQARLGYPDPAAWLELSMFIELYRARIDERAAQRGEPSTEPRLSISTVLGLFVVWPNALKAADLIDEPTRRLALRMGSRFRFDEDACIEAVAGAIRECGLPLRVSEYDAFRDAVHLDSDDDNFALPSAWTVQAELDARTWLEVVLQVIAEDPSLGTEEQARSRKRKTRTARVRDATGIGGRRARVGEPDATADSADPREDTQVADATTADAAGAVTDRAAPSRAPEPTAGHSQAVGNRQEATR